MKNDVPYVYKRFINLTPHVVRMNDGREFEPSGVVARVSAIYGEPDEDGVMAVEFGAVSGLPAPVDGDIYVVSGMVAQAVCREDVVSPATGHPDAVRDKGQIVSVPGFVR